MRKVKYLIVVLFFTVLAAVVGCNVSAADYQSYLVVDINPSIEIVTNRHDKVVYASALNDDGEVLLVETELEGLNIESAVDLVIDRCVELGFIDPENEEITVNVTVAGRDKVKEDKLRDKVCNKFNNSFAAKGLHGFAKKKELNEELLAEAENLGIAPEHLLVIKKVIALNPELTLEECLEMPLEDLVKMIRNLGQEIKEIVHENKEQFFTARDALFNEYKPLMEQLHTQIEELLIQIESAADEEEKAQLTNDLNELRAELKILRDEFHEKHNELKEQYRQNSKEAKERIRNEFHARKEEHKGQVEEFRHCFEEKKDKMKEEIEEWQKQHKGRP